MLSCLSGMTDEKRKKANSFEDMYKKELSKLVKSIEESVMDGYSKEWKGK